MPFPHRAARLVFPLIALMATIALAAAPALASDNDEDEGVVAVKLSDFTDLPAVSWAVSATPSATEEKKVTFNISNISRFIPHQFIVIKTDLAADALPRLGPGLGVDESKVDVVARFQSPGTATQPPDTLAAGQSAALSAKLKNGNYVLICNLDPKGVPFRSHYDQGMRTGFRVGDDD